MIVALIVTCEVGFWVLLAAGLAARYLLRMPRTGLALLCAEPLLEVVLLVATAIDLRNGAEPSAAHGVAALYIGYTVGHGHTTVKWLDGHAAHRLAGGPPPVKPPRYGMARARYEGRLWLGTLVAAAVATGLLLLAMGYVGRSGDTGTLRDWILVAWRVAGIHGLIALAYFIWPKKDPGKGPTKGSVGDLGKGMETGPETKDPAESTPAGHGFLRQTRKPEGSALPARDPQDVPDGLVRHPGQDEQQV